jgi:hypothetical protein
MKRFNGKITQAVGAAMKLGPHSICPFHTTHPSPPLTKPKVFITSAAIQRSGGSVDAGLWPRTCSRCTSLSNPDRMMLHARDGLLVREMSEGKH